MDAQTAAAEPQDIAAETSASPLDKAEAAILARDEAGGGPGTSAKPKPAKVENDPKKPRSSDIAAIAQREWKAKQTEDAAKKVQERYAPLDQALEKKDLKAYLSYAADKGFTFADFVKVLTEAEETKEKTPAEIAAETVEAKLKEADEARTKAETEARAKDLDARIKAQKSTIRQLAESDATRWELAGLNPAMPGIEDDAGNPVLANEYAWKLIEADWDAQAAAGQTPKSMSLEDALDLVEAKLREKQSARRPKTDAGKPKPGAKTGNEAAATKAGGKAGKPSFTNRSTSGAATVVDEDEESADESGATRDGDDIMRAAKRSGIASRLRI